MYGFPVRKMNLMVKVVPNIWVVNLDYRASEAACATLSVKAEQFVSSDKIFSHDPSTVYPFAVAIDGSSPPVPVLPPTNNEPRVVSTSLRRSV